MSINGDFYWLPSALVFAIYSGSSLKDTNSTCQFSGRAVAAESILHSSLDLSWPGAVSATRLPVRCRFGAIVMRNLCLLVWLRQILDNAGF